MRNLESLEDKMEKLERGLNSDEEKEESILMDFRRMKVKKKILMVKESSR